MVFYIYIQKLLPVTDHKLTLLCIQPELMTKCNDSYSTLYSASHIYTCQLMVFDPFPKNSDKGKEYPYRNY